MTMETIRVVVRVPERQVVVVRTGIRGAKGEQGEQGIPGEQGEQGVPGNAAGYTFTQSTPSSSWVMNHNLGYHPVVTLYTVGGLEIEAEVLHTSLNQAVASFVMPVAGSARLV